jgi:hypothetical protein
VLLGRHDRGEVDQPPQGRARAVGAVGRAVGVWGRRLFTGFADAALPGAQLAILLVKGRALGAELGVEFGQRGAQGLQGVAGGLGEIGGEGLVVRRQALDQGLVQTGRAWVLLSPDREVGDGLIADRLQGDLPCLQGLLGSLARLLGSGEGQLGAVMAVLRCAPGVDPAAHGRDLLLALAHGGLEGEAGLVAGAVGPVGRDGEALGIGLVLPGEAVAGEGAGAILDLPREALFGAPGGAVSLVGLLVEAAGLLGVVLQGDDVLALVDQIAGLSVQVALLDRADARLGAGERFEREGGALPGSVCPGARLPVLVFQGADAGLVGHDQRARSAPCGEAGGGMAACVGAVGLVEVIERLAGPIEIGEAVAVLFEVLEGTGRLDQQVVVQGAQALGEHVGDPVGVEVGGELGAAQRQDQLDHRLVAGGAEAEQPLVDGLAVLGGGGDDRAIAEQGSQRLAREGPALVVDQGEILARRAIGEEEPGVDVGGVVLGTHADADGDALVGVRPGERHPRVAVGRLATAGEQVVAHRSGGAAERVEAARIEPAVEHERKQDLQGLGLARAVGAAQHEPTVFKAEGLVDVVPEVEQARAVGTEAGHADGAPNGSVRGGGRTSASRYRCSAGSGTMPPGTRRTRSKAIRWSMASRRKRSGSSA